MPIYEYKCYKCNVVETEMHGMNESPKVICPKCKKGMERKISAPGIHFKGTGFYTTDNREVSQIHPEAAKAHSEGKI